MELQEIKKYFGNNMVLFENNNITSKLSEKEKEILFQIGLPNYNGYAGTYIMLPKMELIDNRYLKFATRKGDESEYSEYIDLETKNIVFRFYSEKYNYLNSNLETYLKYLYAISFFSRNIKNQQKLGDYFGNSEKYAKELEKRLLKINDDVKKGSWSALIEEMSYGLV